MSATPCPQTASNTLMSRIGTILTLALVFCVAVGFAQEKRRGDEQNTRSVQGTVTTGDGAPVTGAVVQLKNLKTLQIRSFISKERGEYYFRELSPDVEYELRADYQGASSDTRTLSSFDSRKQAIINLKLKK